MTYANEMGSKYQLPVFMLGFKRTLDYIKDLYNLIDYQSKTIWQQRKEIIAIKHKEAWKRYDKPEQDYDPSTRKFIDKPR